MSRKRLGIQKRVQFDLLDAKKAPKYIALIFLITGLIIVAGGTAINRYEARSLANSVPVTATVIRLDDKFKRRRKSDTIKRRRKKVYRPVFEASAPDGTLVTYESHSWRRPAQFKVGQVVDALYNQQNGVITTSQLNGISTNLWTIMRILGAIFAAGGLLALIMLGRNRRI